MSYNGTNYFHAVSRIAYLENLLITEDELLKAAGAGSPAEAHRMLSAKAIFHGREIGMYEAAFEEDLMQTYMFIEEITGNSGLTHVFRYPIDGHNMKVMIKSRAVDKRWEHLYESGGTVRTEIMENELSAETFEVVPEKLGKAGLIAAENLARTGDPQTADFIVDKAVLELMSGKADRIGDPALNEYVMLRIDLINLRAALRMFRSGMEEFTVEKVFAPGGNFDLAELKRAYTAGYDGIKLLAAGIPGDQKLADAIEQIKNGSPIDVFERCEGQLFKKMFEKYDTSVFGAEPVIEFLYFKYREIKACRLLFVLKTFDMPEAEIAERLRGIYGN